MRLMGHSLGRMGLGRGRGRATACLGLVLSSTLLLSTACGGDDDPTAGLPAGAGGAPPTTEGGLLPCSEDRHVVAFDIIGFLTVENIEVLGRWGANTVNEPPTPRPGSVELVRAYRQRGYEILYVTTIPPQHFGAVSVSDTVQGWLQASGYPVDAGTHIWAWDGAERPDGQTWVGITDELLRLSSEGVSIDAGYTENVDKSMAYATGGVPEASNYTISPVEGIGDAAPTSAPTTVIPNDDLTAHTASVQQLPAVCQVS